MPNIKPPGVAGQFYPENAGALQNTIHQLLKNKPALAELPKAMIVPHAALQYSGETAAKAYAGLDAYAKHVQRVVMLGPTHRVAVPGMAIPTCDYFATPLGNIELDKPALMSMRQFKKMWLTDKPFEQEHCLEVQLPFLQTLLGDFKLIPILCSAVTPEEVGAILAYLWGGSETLIIISSDLSHYLTYDQCCALDLTTNHAILTMHENEIGDQQACGRYAVRGLLSIAKKFGLSVQGIDLCNSGDVTQDKSRVVGYGSYHFYQPIETRIMYNIHQKQILMDIARQSVLHHFKNGTPIPIDAASMPFNKEQKVACFVSFYLDGKLRGCCGTIQAHLPVFSDVANNACLAAFKDRRFPPLTEDEFKKVHLSIYILGAFQEMTFSDESDLAKKLRPGIDGIVLALPEEKKNGTFLPIVWHQIPDRKNFIRQLKVKMELPLDFWSDKFVCYRFQMTDQMDDELIC